MKTKLLLMLLAVALMAGVAEANMLLNPSFENGAFGTGTPDYWVHFYADWPEQHVWIDDDAEAHSGDRFMEMFNWIPYGSNSDAYLGQAVLGVVEGEEYFFGVWAKTAAGLTKTAEIYLDWYSTSSILTSSADGWMDYEIVSVPGIGDTWTEVDFGGFTAPEGAIAAYFWLAASTVNDVNAIYYDDASMIGPDPNVHAGPDMVALDGQSVSLTGSTELVSYSTITWSADPAESATITDGDTLTPDVTVDNYTGGEFSTIEMRLDIDGKYDLMKIDVYDDACLAAIAAGKKADNPTDIAGDDCLTNLADFAALAKTWLANKGLTGAEPKN